MEDKIKGKHFSIIDQENVSTIVYKLDETEKKVAKNAPKYTIERLEHTEEFVGEKMKKTFYINDPDEKGNSLIILSFGEEKVVVNIGLLEQDKITITKQTIPIKFKNIYAEKPSEFREVPYTPNLKRPITIIDTETTEEVKPVLYFDEVTNEIKGKCKLKPYKSYFAFEIKEEKNDGKADFGCAIVETNY